LPAVILDLVPQLHVGGRRRGAGRGNHRTPDLRIALLECQPRRAQRRNSTSGAAGMLLHVPLQVHQCSGTITACLLELRDREQRVVGIERQWIFHDHAAIVPLRFGGGGRERPVPIEGIAVGWRRLIGGAQQRIHERASSHAISFCHKPARPTKE
jgi:hypothetical protein